MDYILDSSSNYLYYQTIKKIKEMEKVTYLFEAFFNSKKLEKAGLITVISGVVFMIIECVISVIQKQ